MALLGNQAVARPLVFIVVLGICATLNQFWISSNVVSMGRDLFSTKDQTMCTDAFDEHTILASLTYLSAMGFVFIGLHVLVEGWFSHAMEAICVTFKISEDVAGRERRRRKERKTDEREMIMRAREERLRERETKNCLCF